MSNLLQMLLNDSSDDDAITKAQRRQQERIEQSNLRFLSDDGALDKLVATQYAKYAPVVMKAKKANQYFLPTEAMDAAIPDNHPQKGAVSRVKDTVLERLQSEEALYKPAGIIAQEAALEDFKGTADAAYRFKRSADVGILDIIPGYDWKDKRYNEQPGYQQWLEKERASEQTRFAEDDDISNPVTWLKDLGIAAGAGGAFGAVAGATGGGLAGALGSAAVGAATGFALGNIPGAVVGGALGLVSGGAVGSKTGAVAGAAAGAAAGVVTEIGGKIARNLLHKTEWYAANSSSGKGLDTAMAIGADLGVSIAGGIGALKVGKIVKGVQADQSQAVAPKTQAENNARLQEILHRKFSKIFPEAVEETTDRTVAGYNERFFERSRKSTTKDTAEEFQGNTLPQIYQYGSPKVVREQLQLTNNVKQLPFRQKQITYNQDTTVLPSDVKAIDTFAAKVNKVNPPEVTTTPKVETVTEAITKKVSPKTELNAVETSVVFNSLDDTSKAKALNTLLNPAIPEVKTIAEATADRVQAQIVAAEVKQAEKTFAANKAWIKDKFEKEKGYEKRPKITRLANALVDIDRSTFDAKADELAKAGKPFTARQKELYETLTEGSDVATRTKALKSNNDIERILKKWYGPDVLSKIPMIAGATALSYFTLESLLSPQPAEAGMLKDTAAAFSKIPGLFKTSAQKAVQEGKHKEFLDDLVKAKMVVVEHTDPRQLPTQFQEQLNVPEYAAKHYGSLPNAVENVKGKTRSGFVQFMSGIGEDIIMKSKAKATVQVASIMSAIESNTAAAQKVAKNILKRVPGATGNWEAVDLAMRDLQKQYVSDYAPVVYASTQMALLEKSIKGVTDVIKSDKKVYRDFVLSKLGEKAEEYNKYAAMVEGGQEKYKAFLTNLTEKQKELAEKYSSVRLGLAAEDNSNFTNYPWLKNLVTPDEAEAANYIKAFFKRYEERLVAGEHSVKGTPEKPYVHHALPPGIFADKEAVDALQSLQFLPGKALPYTKFFHRMDDSVNLMPDIEYVLQKYIPDTERRLQYSQFWKQWKPHMVATKGMPGHREFWENLSKAMTPAEATPLNVWSNRYYSYEVINMLGGSVSAAFKHLFKMVGTVSYYGLRATAAETPESFRQANRLAKEYWTEIISGSKIGAKVVEATGLDKGKAKSATDMAVDAVLSTSRHSKTFAEMELDAGIAGRSGWKVKLDDMLMKAADMAAFPIKYIEWFDRAHTVLAVREMAIKKGMTATDAAYNVYDTVIRMNFLGGPLNSTWQRNPMMRTLLMFQNTPTKLLERRLVNALKTKDSMVAFKDVVFKGFNEQVKALEDVQGVMRYVKAAENTVKGNVLKDAIKAASAVDSALGVPFYKQFVNDIFWSGLIISLGAKAFDANLLGHTFHLPGLRANTEEPTLSLNPLVTGVYRTFEGKGENSDDFLFTRFVNNWQGKKGFIPQTIYKTYQITEDDVPEIYKDSWMKYLFAVPAVKDKE